jgi:hypothetical protein
MEKINGDATPKPALKKNTNKRKKRSSDGASVSVDLVAEGENQVRLKLFADETITLDTATFNENAIDTAAAAKEEKRKKKKTVNFSQNHLEDVAGFADDIDREAWELPRTCDGCGLYILGERWSCAKCLKETEDEFDLCKGCFVSFKEFESGGGDGNGDTTTSSNDNSNNPWNNGGDVPMTSEDLHRHDSNAFERFDEENEESIAEEELEK